MEKYCKRCGNDVEGVDAKGDGVHLVYYCEECDCIVGEPTMEEARSIHAEIEYQRQKEEGLL